MRNIIITFFSKKKKIKKKKETPLATIEETFLEFTHRKDIAIVLINQHVCILFIYNICFFFIFKI